MSVTEQQPRRHRGWRVAKGSAIVLAALAALGAVASWGLEWWCCARPPAIEGRPAALDLQLTESDGVRRMGPAWLARKHEILRMHLEGDPFTLGYCNAVLTQEFFRDQEAELIRLVKRYVPSAINRWLLRKYVLFQCRDLPSHIALPYQMELAGLARGTPDAHPEIGPLYHRLLNYHAAHDISHAVMDHPLVGCTSFAAWGAATQDGHLLIGRNFDFDALRSFDQFKIVIHVKPSEGLSFLSVAWPGLIGVVSGINEARIAISVNAAQSKDVRRVGTPVSLVMREVMQRASTLEEAIEIIRRHQVFVSDSYLVADGKTGQAVVVEKTPLRTAVRRPTGDYLIGSNHFLTDDLKDDEANVRYMAEGTSVVRYERMEALVAGRKRPLTPRDVALILRDRRVPGVVGARHASPLQVLGHPAALNSLTATHSVILDVTAGILWVSGFPHQLGAYVPFGLATFEDPPGAAAIEPDPLLADGSYERCGQARTTLATANRLLRKGDRDAALPLLREAAELNPGLYLPHFLLGKLAFEAKQWPEAKERLAKAQALYPAFGSEREAVRRMLDAMGTE